MSTTTSPSKGALSTNGLSDPFVAPTSYGPRYASLDFDHLSSYSANSPTQAKRALEAHLKETERRIQDASRLGTTLIQQRKELAARLQEVEDVKENDEVPTELRKRLADLEKEYNEVGKESARAFLPKAKIDPSSTPSALTGSGRESPTKLTAPSRRTRNQPSNRVHDIEFATEISTSLLAQVRQLQAALAQKDEELKDTTAAKAQLEADATGMAQRVKHLDDKEQRYKDENWNLETRLQDLEASHKDVTDREQKALQNLKTTQGDKAAAQRDLDDLKVSHEKLNEEHAAVKRQQELELHGLRRDITTHESEKGALQKRIDELTSQNTELAKAVSYRFNGAGAAAGAAFVAADDDGHLSDGTPEESAPESPIKGTPARHGMLESETLKSSLNHAHRMIQNLKNNIHREKTEKIELKRMLQEARDELESKRSESGGVVGANVGKKRRSEQDSSKFKKPLPRTLGANRSSTTEILEDEPDWEDNDGTATPTKSSFMPGAFVGAGVGAVAGYAAGVSTGGEETEGTDAAFETATERGGPSDAFETGRESMDDESEELTETEAGSVSRNRNISKAAAALSGVPAAGRQSFQSTASDDELQTPQQIQQQQKYRLRVNGGSSKRNRVSDLMRDSPASSIGTPQGPGQSLGDELDALDEGTPSRYTDSAVGTPDTQRAISVAPDTPDVVATPLLASKNTLTEQHAIVKPTYADAGMMTEPWTPEAPAPASDLKDKAMEVVGGALAGMGLGSLISSREHADTDAEAGASHDSEVPATIRDEPLQFSSVMAQHVQPTTPLLPERSDRRLSAEQYGIPGTDATRPGAGFFGIASLGGADRAVERDSVGLMPLVPKLPMMDGGSQTDVSGDDIEEMIRNKNRISTVADLPVRSGAGFTSSGGRRSLDGVSNEAAPLRTPRRPASSGSMRNRTSVGTAPPLPVDHTVKIAQAAQKDPQTPGTAIVGTMGPPLMPASAYKQARPRTPAESTRVYPRDGTTPRARQVQSPTLTQASRRTSLSSFVSEVDERINGRSQFMYPEGVIPSTDPRMIQAITQTMIGEYLWKYTRKAGRSEPSNTRHRRFFWVHPYTRTLYWSEKDPSTAGRDMLKAKSVAIDAVRVISDDNAYPPGLHRKSLVIVTPGREIIITAPTGQRHETWFNALSYLLLRTEQEKAEAEDEMNQDDLNEFNPGFGSSIRQSITRFTTGRSHSRVSLSSYNSRTTRNSSPTRGGRTSATPGLHSRPPPSPSRAPAPDSTSTSRYSSLTNKFRSSASAAVRGRTSTTSSTAPGQAAGSEIYNASVAADSAEDLRAQMERQEREADRLENVRACCDGKHDVASLSRRSRGGMGHRFSAHTHTHPHIKTEPLAETIRR
ncbi:hypothetical protein BDY17DRAFT_326065 [Neohortaea acidophila]|uniref:PH domain-containing protein n=1 Tax=Neohortaea acidophila TaxID=245834 RepID=A0A6A6PMQ8_9PEZI|nr:uncharacterized protein BDY17DRAFT_326065 [Neohortaea acidophila]KAF2481370.1 hypothetical protein BDY17DRAFT_326065 [Neohortaea acidophila]